MVALEPLPGFAPKLHTTFLPPHCIIPTSCLGTTRPSDATHLDRRPPLASERGVFLQVDFGNAWLALKRLFCLLGCGALQSVAFGRCAWLRSIDSWGGPLSSFCRKRLMPHISQLTSLAAVYRLSLHTSQAKAYKATTHQTTTTQTTTLQPQPSCPPVPSPSSLMTCKSSPRARRTSPTRFRATRPTSRTPVSRILLQHPNHYVHTLTSRIRHQRGEQEEQR